MFICVHLRRQTVVNKLTNGSITSGGQLVVDTSEMLRGYEAHWDEAIIDLAGLAFEKILRPKLSILALLIMGDAVNDYADALRLVRSSLRLLRPEQYMLREWFPAALKIVRSEWAAIMKVGNALHACGQLTQQEVRELVVKRAKKPSASKGT